MKYNLFMYCNGDPVNGVDMNGYSTITLGGDVSGGILFGGSFSLGVSIDDIVNDKNNFAYK